MNRFRALILALLCALFFIQPALADVNYGVTPSNSRPAPGPLVYVWSGSNWIPWPSDADGTPYMRPWTPAFELILQKSNVTIAAAAVDTSAIPVITSPYRQIWAEIRIKAASFAATGKLELAIKRQYAAQQDSSALGWFVPMGAGALRKGKCIPLVTLADRWQSVALVDSLAQVPIQAPFLGYYLTNLTGAQVIADVWFYGVRY